MATPLTLDFVSDVACPWCAVGLFSLQQALRELPPDVPVQLRFQPFELNPDMGPEGQDLGEHLTHKYGSTPEQQAQVRAQIAARGAEVGFAFAPEGRGRVWNTFDAHRLLAWAEGQGEGAQHRLKVALLQAYQGRGERISDPQVLRAAVAQAGLDVVAAAEVLDSDAYADKVRAVERLYQRSGIHAVPALVVNDRWLISGGQPVAAYAQSLRQILAELAQAAGAAPAAPPAA